MARHVLITLSDKEARANMKDAIVKYGQAAVFSVVVAILSAVSAPLRAAPPEGLLNKKELKLLIANAMTPEDHQELARHFAEKANRLDADSKEHERMAAEYRRIRGENPFEMKFPMSPRTAAHCEYFAEQRYKAAQEARSQASLHQGMARQVGR